MSANLPTPENFPQPSNSQKVEREQQEGRQEQTEQRETLEDVLNQGLDQAGAAANILAVDIKGKMQAVANQGAMLKQSDQQLLLNIINQGKSATTNLKNKLGQLISDDNQDSEQAE